MKFQFFCTFFIACLLTAAFVDPVKADLDLGDKFDGFVSWFKVKFNTAKTKASKIVDNVIESADKRLNFRNLRTTTQAATTKSRKDDIICGLNRYDAIDGIANTLRTLNVRKTNRNIEENSVSMRISGGRVAKANEIPWQVRLVIDEIEQCGATLLNSRTLLTAAHCAVNRNPDAYAVYLAEHSLLVKDVAENVVRIAKVIQHPKYDEKDTWVNDFAILITETEIAFDQKDKYLDSDDFYIRPVCMPISTDFQGELAGLQATISGWGHSDSQENGFSPLLQVGKVTMMNHYVCKRLYKDMINIAPGMICASFDKGHVFVDSCQGDSGGGITALKHGRSHLIGVTSFGIECNNKDKIPGVYGRVTSVLDWIQQNAVGHLHYVN